MLIIFLNTDLSFVFTSYYSILKNNSKQTNLHYHSKCDRLMHNTSELEDKCVMNLFVLSSCGVGPFVIWSLASLDFWYLFIGKVILIPF